MTTFDIRLFGAIEIRRDGELLTDFRSQKALVLLAYLICENRPITRDYLAGLGWPEMEQSQALGLLRRSLHDLNSQLPGCLEIDRRTVYFNPSAPATVDIHQLADLMARNNLEAWAGPVALYRAPFLQGVYVDDAPELESWLLREQERWQGEQIRILNMLATYHTERAAYPEALDFTQQVLAIEPWREEAHRQAMLLLARLGQTSAALAQYETCRRTLREELDVEPADETKSLRARIGAMAHTPAHPLPTATTRFVGRTAELAELTQLLASGHCRLITLVGPGGMGKTRLAIETARSVISDQRWLFLHGVYFVALVGVDTLAQFVSALGQALAFTFQAQRSPETQLLHYLRDKELLLVLDNFEQLVIAPILAFVRQLLDTAPASKLLITSRIRLHLQSEQLYWLQGLHVPVTTTATTTLSLAETIIYSSVQLFLTTVRRSQPHYALSTDDAPTVMTICQLVQGMPLAIELAAAWMSVLTPGEIAAELARNLDFLASEAHDLPLRQRSMRAVFDTSWRLLTETERAVFQQLTVFRGGFTGEAAQAVTKAPLAALVGLVHKAFLYRTPADRFEVHELLRQFGQEQLNRRHELQTTQQRHADYFMALAEEAERHFFTDRQRRWIERLECEHDNLRAVLTWALEHRVTEYLLRLACALQKFWDCRGYYLEMNHWLEQALVLAEQAWGDLSISTGEACEAPMRAQLNLVAHALFARANALMHDRESAEALYSRSLLIDQRIGPTPRTMEIFQALSWIERRRGNFDRADELQRETLQLAQTLPDFQGQERQRKIAYAIAIGSVNALFQADLARSATLATQALSLWDAVEDRRLITYGVSVLGHIALRQKDFERAHSLLTDCYTQFIEDGDTEGVVFLRCLLGILALQRGDWRVAQTAFIENLTWLQHYNRDHDALLHNLRGLADAIRQRGGSRLAAQLLGAAEKLRQMLKYVIAPIYRPDFEETLTATRAQLDAASFASAYAQGYAMTLEQAVTFALANI